MLNGPNLKITFFFAIVMASLYTFAGVMQVSFGNSDILEHAKIAEGFRNGGQVPPHFLYHFLLNAISSLSGMPYIYVSFLAIFIIVLMTFIVATRSIGDAVTGISRYVVILSACFLLLSHPIPIVFPYDNHIYYGYIASNVYHNPTILLLKPIALVHFVLLCKLLGSAESEQANYLEVMLLATLSALSVIAKPNYIIILLPALLCFWLWCRYFLKKTSCGLFVICAGVGAPASVLLMGMFAYFYGPGGGGSIGVGLFDVFETTSKLWTLVPKLIGSLLFPVSVIVAMGSKLFRRLDFQLSFLMLVIAMTYSYCLVDGVGGSGIAHGNFWWSAQIAHFLLLFVCIKAYLGFAFNIEGGFSAKNIVPFFPLYIGGMHLISGIIWYVFSTSPRLIKFGW